MSIFIILIMAFLSFAILFFCFCRKDTFLPNSVQNTAPNQKVVAFDIDDTLFINQENRDITCDSIIVEDQVVSKSGFDIIKKSVEKGFNIGIVTARPIFGAKLAAPVIQKLFDMAGYKYDKYFFDIGNTRSAFQYGFVFNKQNGMENLQRIYGTERRNMILIDDKQMHIDSSIKAGFLAVKSCSDDICHCGITPDASVLVYNYLKN